MFFLYIHIFIDGPCSLRKCIAVCRSACFESLVCVVEWVLGKQRINYRNQKGSVTAEALSTIATPRRATSPKTISSACAFYFLAKNAASWPECRMQVSLCQGRHACLDCLCLAVVLDPLWRREGALVFAFEGALLS